MGYRVSGILHIYTAANRRGAQRYSFPVEGDARPKQTLLQREDSFTEYTGF